MFKFISNTKALWEFVRDFVYVILPSQIFIESEAKKVTLCDSFNDGVIVAIWMSFHKAQRNAQTCNPDLATQNMKLRSQNSVLWYVCQKSCQCFRNCWSIHLKVYDITRLSQVPRLLWFFLVVIGLLLYIIIVLYYILSACSSMSTICMRVPNMININIRIINNFELLSEIYECH